jgi:hypothetical protein
MTTYSGLALSLIKDFRRHDEAKQVLWEGSEFRTRRDFPPWMLACSSMTGR